jgi:hypothetical protein
MEPEDSSSCFQEATTGPYLKPDESIPLLSTLFAKIHSNIIPPYTPSSCKWSLPFI